MLLYRLIVLSWCLLSYEGHKHGHKSKKTKKQSIATSPLQEQQQQTLANAAAQTLHRQAVLHNARRLSQQIDDAQQRIGDAQQRTVDGRQERIPQRLLSSRQRLLAQQRMLNAPLGRHMHHPARPSHVKGHGKDLLSQVVASTMPNHHHMQRGAGGLLTSDHPKKYVDYFDNGANWDHFMSRPESSNSEMNIDDANYHVHLKYGGHDELDEDDKIMGTGGGHGETYPGESISTENSLSKFMSPPVYDEQEAVQQQKEQEMYEAERRFAPDSPEAAATEKMNTDELVDRLNSLMTPLSSPFDADGAKKNNLNHILSMHHEGMKPMNNMPAPKHRMPSSYDESRSNPNEAAAREKMNRYASQDDSPDERHYHDMREQPSRGESNAMQGGDERMQMMERMNERAQMKESGANEANGDARARESFNMGASERRNPYYHGESKNMHSPSQMEEAEEEGEESSKNREENAYRERMAVMMHRQRAHNSERYEEMYRERLLNNRGNSPKHMYYREREREEPREEEEEESETKGESRSYVNIKDRPDRYFDSPKYHGRRIN